MKKINELVVNNFVDIDPRILNRFISSLINYHNIKWEICDIIFYDTFEDYKPNFNKNDLYIFFKNICDDLNKKGKDCNYNIYNHIGNLFNIEDLENKRFAR